MEILRLYNMYNEGLEVGDMHHSEEFPPYVVDTIFNLMRWKLVASLTTANTFPFVLPVFLICVKDQSKLRLEYK